MSNNAFQDQNDASTPVAAKQRPLGKLHRDPSRAMQQMMNRIDELRSVYEDETDALERMDTRSFMALQDNKIHHAMAYESGIHELMARKNEMQGVDNALKDKLRKMQEDFASLSQKNMEALQRMQRTMDRLGNTIRSAAKEEAKKQRVFSYGQNGEIDSDDKKKISIGISEEA